jgi:hypothetical protein
VAQGRVRRGQGQGKDSATHGQVVSNCNHQANERKLQADDRKHFVEWCTERGERYGYDQQRYNYDRNCYQSADGKACPIRCAAPTLVIAEQKDREYDRDRTREQDRDVPNKGAEKKN